MTKYAVLAGCNYKGTNAELRGCINDVWDSYETLKTCLGFQESNMVVMIDTDKSYVQPTGKNIKAEVAKMVAKAVDGDELFLHFSGHGTQVPTDDPKERDGKDEAICPCDMNIITDADLALLLAPLAAKPKCKFTFVADCCHSGTLLDHNQVIITGPKAGAPPPPKIDAAAIQAMLASLGAGGNRDVKGRALPFSTFSSILSSMLGGGQKVDVGNISQSMRSLFGNDTSAKSMDYTQYLAMAQKVLSSLPPGTTSRVAGMLGGMLGGGAGGGALGGILSSLAGSGGGANTAGGASGGGGGGMFACCMGGGAQPSEGTKPPAATAQSPLYSAPAPPAGGHTYAELDEDIGVLISGCMSSETAADAMPGGDPTKAHGALTRALNTVVRAQHSQNPGTPVTYRNLVIAVRESLTKAGFAQSPCLECDNKWADEPYVLH